MNKKIEYIKKIDNDYNLYKKILTEKILIDYNLVDKIEKEKKNFFSHIFEQKKIIGKRIDNNNLKDEKNQDKVQCLLKENNF